MKRRISVLNLTIAVIVLKGLVTGFVTVVAGFDDSGIAAGEFGGRSAGWVLLQWHSSGCVW